MAARRLSLWALLLGLAALAVEAGSYAFFTLARDRFSFVGPAQYVVTDRAALDGLRRSYDRELGWTQNYDTPRGERPRTREYDRPAAMAFGDSFTHGAEVESGETWAEALAASLQGDVYNFGVGGYGADQALLRFRKVAPRVPAPVVLFGFELGNIDRVVNVYRPFLLRATGIPLTKPRFELRSGALVLIPNPVETEAQLERLMDPGFVDQIGARDYWYAAIQGPRLRFPYSRLLFDRSIWRQALAARSFRGEVAARPEEDLWRVPEPRALFLAILDAFVAETKALGRKPVLVVLPGFPAFHRLRRVVPVPGLDAVLAHCRARGYDCFDALTLLVKDPAGRKADVFFRPGGHPSPEANRIIGAALADDLRAR